MSDAKIDTTHSKSLEAKKRLAELLGWSGLSIAVPAYSADGKAAVCLTSPKNGRLIEADIPAWDRNWNAYGDLIVEHQIQVTPGKVAAGGTVFAQCGAIVTVLVEYADHPGEASAVRCAAMEACIGKLEADLAAQSEKLPTRSPGMGA